MDRRARLRLVPSSSTSSLAGAWLLGRDAREVLTHGRDPERSLGNLEAILSPEIDADGALQLVAQMPSWDRERQLSLLAAFYAGLFDSMARIRRG